MEGENFCLFFLLGKIFNRLFYARKRKRKRERERERERALKPVWSRSSQFLCCWFFFDPGVVHWFSITQAPSGKLPIAGTTPTKQ
jgi:uncharacterized membrane protein